eukprot:SAG31_NODE_38649_length_294_cov_1.317949_1_plen_23_part_01
MMPTAPAPDCAIDIEKVATRGGF